MSARAMYPPISHYALIGDCHSAALVSRRGSIDWCCLPRFDSDSCFGRLLDWQRGGHFEIVPQGHFAVHREYVRHSLILVTTFTSGRNVARLIDFFAMREGGRMRPRRELVRILEGVRGHMRFRVRVAPRIDFGDVKPWVYRAGHGAYVCAGSNTGLLVFGDIPLEPRGGHDLVAEVEVRPRKRLHVALQFVSPARIHAARAVAETRARLAAHYKETLSWWRTWSQKLLYPEESGVGVTRSAIVLKALTYAPTGAIIAAPTTSLPERIGGERNWDYRFSWLRDSVFTVRALSELGLEAEADGFRRFIQRSAAGNADELQVMYAVDGKRRLDELRLQNLEGWRNSQPVRIGNAAAEQYQGDMYGLVLELAWRWSERDTGTIPYWPFLRDLVESAIARWRQPDRGIWEIRSRPRHFVNSKVMCWSAVNRGIALAEELGLEAPLERWRLARAQMRSSIEKRGFDRRRGVFVQSYGSTELDASLLLLPSVEFVAFTDERMMRTAQLIARELASHDGFIVRYRTVDGLSGREGAFLPCTFWLVECFAHQGRLREARRLFRRACSAANDVGLFAEEYSPRERALLGNFPQGLTHLAHISAALALNGAGRPSARPGPSRKRGAARLSRR
jgi:GH15 family glucan-1,4-alpha-glucosidase